MTRIIIYNSALIKAQLCVAPFCKNVADIPSHIDITVTNDCEERSLNVKIKMSSIKMLSEY